MTPDCSFCYLSASRAPCADIQSGVECAICTPAHQSHHPPTSCTDDNSHQRLLFFIFFNTEMCKNLQHDMSQLERQLGCTNFLQIWASVFFTLFVARFHFWSHNVHGLLQIWAPSLTHLFDTHLEWTFLHKALQWAVSCT